MKLKTIYRAYVRRELLRSGIEMKMFAIFGLLASLLFACPALGADYYVSNAGSGSACSMASPCDEIADINALSLSGNDNVYFNRGDTFADTTLVPPDSGTSGNPITFDAYGSGNQPIIGDSSLSHALLIDAGQSWLDFQNLDFQGTNADGVGLDETIQIDDASNINFSDCTISRITGSDGSEPAVRIGQSVATTDINFTDCIFQDSKGRLVILREYADDIAFTTSTFIFTQNLTGNFHSFIGDHAQNSIYTDCIFDTGPLTRQMKFVLDFLGEFFSTATHTVSGGSLIIRDDGWIGAIQTAAVAGFDLNVNISDFTVEMEPPISTADTTDTSRNYWLEGRGNATVTLTRDMFIGHHDDIRGGLRLNNTDGGSDITVNLNASTLFIRSGETGRDFIEIEANMSHSDGGINIKNSTLVMQSGASGGLQAIRINSGATGAVDIKNSIILTDDSEIIQEEGGTMSFDLANNLYEREDQTTGWFIFDTEGTLDESDVGSTSPVDDSGSATGDPAFASQDETSGVYLMPTPGSPAIGLGDAASLYATPATDIHGARFNGTTPNAGAVAQRIIVK